MSKLNKDQIAALAPAAFGEPTKRLIHIVDQEDVDGAAEAIRQFLGVSEAEALPVVERVKRIASSKSLVIPESLKHFVVQPEEVADTLVAYGTAVKISDTDPYKIERGYLVLFSGAEDPDLSGEFFTKDTDFRPLDGKSAVTGECAYYDHGLDKTLKKAVIAEVTTGIDAKGVWIEGQIDKANKYADDISKLGKEGKLGWSSGTAPHLTERKDVLDKAGKVVARQITKWPLGIDASMTTTPCEPRTRPDILRLVVPIKSHRHVPFKVLSEGQEGQFLADSTVTDPDIGTYTYPVKPLLGHTMASKMAREHGSVVHSLYRNRTISTPEYKHLYGGFTDCVKNYHTGLNEDLSNREIDEWTDWDAHYKGVGPGMKTVGDALYAVLTRGHNAGADTLLTRGEITSDEHQAMRSHFETHRDAYLDGIDEGIKSRSLKDCGSESIYLKSSGGENDHGSTLADQVEALLADAEAVKTKSEGLRVRIEDIKSKRQLRGDDLGAIACGHIDNTVAGLKKVCDALEELKPKADEAQEKVRKAKQRLAALS